MTMMKNPILDELHAIRQKLLDDAGGTLDALVDRLQAEEQKSNRQRYRGRRTIRCTGAANSGVSAMESQASPPRDR
jgi:hypothetical protein